MDKRALVITCLLVATCGLCTCLSPIAAVFVDAELGLFRIANRLGIEPRLSAVHEYLDSTIVIGMPRERVHQEFNRIGPTTFSKCAPSMPSCERAVLRVGLIGLEQWEFRLSYDLDENLLSIEQVYD